MAPSLKHDAVPQPGPRRVIAGRIPPDFDPEIDAIPGPWILAGQESAWPEWDQYEFTLTLNTAEEIAAADRLTAEIAESMTALFAERLAERHQSNRSPEFWYLLLVRWVLETLQAAWLRYREAEALIKRHGGDELHIEAPARKTDWAFASIADMYRRGICDRNFNAWLLALALERQVPGQVIWSDTQSLPTADSPMAGRSPKGLRKLFLAVKSGRTEIGNMGSEYNLPTKLFSAAAHLILNAWLAVLPVKRHVRAARATFNPGLRDRIGEDLYDYLLDVLERTVPLMVGGSFAQYDQQARRVRARPGHLSIRTISYQMSAERLFDMAHRIDQGEGLVHLQHGCNYGIAHAYSLGAIIEYNQHAFLTWGWRRHGDYAGRFEPFPSPQLAPWLNSYKRSRDTIVLVSSIVPFLPTRLISNGELHCHERRTDRVDFVTTLAPEKSSDLMYRPYPQLDYAAQDAAYFRAHFPSLRQITSQQAFFREARRCRLMVIDHPGLTFYQALVAGTPVIGFWKDLHWPLEPTVKPMFDELRRVGVLFESGHEAAEALNGRSEDIDAWWRSAEVQGAISAIKEYNTLTSRFWLPIWMKKVLSL